MPMRIYWLDANVPISAKNGAYKFNVFPAFWGFLDAQLRAGSLCCPKMVYKEIVKNERQNDELAVWCKNRREMGMSVAPNKEVQQAYRKVVDYVATSGRWGQAEINEFLRGADPWVIAHALATQGVVVTLESREHPDARKVRIPDVAAHFGVKCVTTIEMLELLGAKF